MRTVRRIGPGVASIFLLSIVVARPVASHATDITTCGTTVAAGDTGVLQNDLDCPSEIWFVVRLLTGSTLKLNGHAIRAGQSTFAAVLGVAYVDDEDPSEGGHGNFTLEGPGEIAGAGAPDPVNNLGTDACVTLQNGRATITSPTGVIDIHNCTFGIVGYILEYANNHARATVDHVIVHDNTLEGITVRKLTASNVTSYGNFGIGIHAGKTLVVNDCVAHDNHGTGFYGNRVVRGANVTAFGNRAGVDSQGRVTLTNLTSTDNFYTWGVYAKRLTLIDSHLSGNFNADIASDSFPRLYNTVCDTSYHFGVGGSWGVCAND